MYSPIGITTEEYRVRDLALRKELLELRRQEVAAAETGLWWNLLTAFVTVGIPLATFLGWQAYFRGKK